MRPLLPNNSVGEQPGENVVASFDAAGLFDHMGNDAHIGLLLDFFWVHTKQVNAKRRIEACYGKYAVRTAFFLFAPVTIICLIKSMRSCTAGRK